MALMRRKCDRAKTVVDLFRERAQSAPNDTAVVYCDVAALSLPYLFVRKALEDKYVYYDLLLEYLQFINIFFIVVIIYLALVLAKRLKLSAVGYAVVGFVFTIAAPFIYGRAVDVPVLGYIVKIIIG